MEQLINLIEGCTGNDEKCQRVFYEKYLGYVLKIVYRYISTYEAAGEATNDAFIKIFRSLNKFEYNNSVNVERLLLGWMRKIAVNTAIDYLRESQAHKRYQPITELPETDSNYLTGTDERVLYKELIELIKKLSPAYRTVFNMYVIDGYTHHEISEALGISEGTSKSNLARARAILQKYLVKNNKDSLLCFT